PLGTGPPPLVERRPPIVPSRPLSYTAIAAYEECPYRFYMERVLGLPGSGRTSARIAEGNTTSTGGDDGSPSAREERSARGAAVHALLEWSQANAWEEPSAELAGRHGVAAGLDAEATDSESLLEPVRDWLGSPLLRDEVDGAVRIRAEVPILLGVGETVLRGSIDLLVEREGGPPLVVDYKTDRLGSADPRERAEKYEIQRSIYALAAAQALGADAVEVAYVFLERAEQPVLTTLGPAEMDAGRERLSAAIDRIGAGEFPVAPESERSWDLCRGCPALGRLCSGPESD
ncbi:MAG: PD-(D/E)XK nuclease family protein, partial [Thermoleophilia bacterium]|nr:PD-(D/E)XK nuclease family protein [Thermoleophilia bacterium]